MPSLRLVWAFSSSSSFFIERYDRVIDDISVWHAAIGMIANDGAGCVMAWCDMGIYPVMITILAAVDDIGENFLVVLDGFPHQFEDATRHIWVTDDIVGMSEHFFF